MAKSNIMTTYEWQPEKVYRIGDMVSHNEVLYMCHKSHMSLNIVKPSEATSILWREATFYDSVQKFYTDSELEKLKQEIARLKEENEKLTNHIQSMPDGQDFFEAKEHYESMASKQDK